MDDADIVEGHVFIAGNPRTGKTTVAKEMFEKMQCAGIFFNVQMEDYFSGHPRVNHTDGIKAVFMGQKVVVSDKRAYLIEPTLDTILKMQQRAPSLKPIWLFIDEAHLVVPMGSLDAEKGKPPPPIVELLSLGLRWNVRTIWITHFPAMVDYRLYRYCRYKIFFELDSAVWDSLGRRGVKVPPENRPHNHQHITLRS